MIDQLKIFRGQPYEINSSIIIKNPILDEICDYGEQRYLSLVQLICSTPSDHKVEIFDSTQMFWDEMDEFILFASFFKKAFRIADMSILFGDLDFQSFEPEAREDIGDVILKNKDGVVIDRAIHVMITDCLRSMHRLKKNTDVGYNNYTKEIMIEDDRDERVLNAKKPFDSIMLPLISSLTNCPEFKYRHDDVWTLPIGVFMDSVYRIQKHKNFDYTMQGIYNGCIDIHKINKKELNWMGELK